MEENKMLSKSDRQHYIDAKFELDVSNADFKNSLFIRLVAKEKRFEKVDFKYTIFDTCYLRNCVFDSCDFTGCRFSGSNFYGAKFSGCKFDYAIFERTIISSEILDSGLPPLENLKLKLARTLRMNYQQIGDTIAVNKAIMVELAATETHLKKAWLSNESYYRKKYGGQKRILLFFQWFSFKLLDIIWGNGESPLKLTRTIIVFLVLLGILDTLFLKNYAIVNSYLDSFVEAPQIFLGTFTPDNYNTLVLAVIVFVRLVAIGGFLSIIIKRFSRR